MGGAHGETTIDDRAGGVAVNFEESSNRPMGRRVRSRVRGHETRL